MASRQLTAARAEIAGLRNTLAELNKELAAAHAVELRLQGLLQQTQRAARDEAGRAAKLAEQQQEQSAVRERYISRLCHQVQACRRIETAIAELLEGRDCYGAAALLRHNVESIDMVFRSGEPPADFLKGAA